MRREKWKILVIILHNIENYGLALQTYGMLKILSSYGTEVKVDYRKSALEENITSYRFYTIYKEIKNYKLYKIDVGV